MRKSKTQQFGYFKALPTINNVQINDEQLHVSCTMIKQRCLLCSIESSIPFVISIENLKMSGNINVLAWL